MSSLHENMSVQQPFAPIWYGSTLNTFLAIISQTSSIVIPMFMMIYGFINNSKLKEAMFYLGFLTLSVVVVSFVFGNVFKLNSTTAKRNCNIMSIPSFISRNGEVSDSLSTFIISFTFAYLVTKMSFLNDYNPGVIWIFSLFLLIDVCFKLYNMCSNFLLIMTNIITAIIFALISNFILYRIDNENYANYFDTNNFDKESCKLGDIKYKCDYEDDD